MAEHHPLVGLLQALQPLRVRTMQNLAPSSVQRIAPLIVTSSPSKMEAHVFAGESTQGMATNSLTSVTPHARGAPRKISGGVRQGTVAEPMEIVCSVCEKSSTITRRTCSTVTLEYGSLARVTLE